jgi:hypothetical protein
MRSKKFYLFVERKNRIAERVTRFYQQFKTRSKVRAIRIEQAYYKIFFLLKSHIINYYTVYYWMAEQNDWTKCTHFHQSMKRSVTDTNKIHRDQDSRIYGYYGAFFIKMCNDRTNK